MEGRDRGREEGSLYRWMDGCINEQMDDGWIKEEIDGWKDG